MKRTLVLFGVVLLLPAGAQAQSVGNSQVVTEGVVSQAQQQNSQVVTEGVVSQAQQQNSQVVTEGVVSQAQQQNSQIITEVVLAKPPLPPGGAGLLFHAFP